MEHCTFNNSLPLREWFHDHYDALLEKYLIKDWYLGEKVQRHPWQIFQQKNPTITMTDSLWTEEITLCGQNDKSQPFKVTIFYSGNLQWHLQACVFIALLFNLVSPSGSSYSLPVSPSHPHFCWITLFHPLSNPPLFSLWEGTGISWEQALSWGWEEPVAMGTVSIAWKGAVANKTILPD